MFAELLSEDINNLITLFNLKQSSDAAELSRVYAVCHSVSNF